MILQRCLLHSSALPCCLSGTEETPELPLYALILQEMAWGPVILSQGGEWAREMPKTNLWPLIVAPPVLGRTLAANDALQPVSLPCTPVKLSGQTA